MFARCACVRYIRSLASFVLVIGGAQILAVKSARVDQMHATFANAVKAISYGDLSMELDSLNCGLCGPTSLLALAFRAKLAGENVR